MKNERSPIYPPEHVVLKTKAIVERGLESFGNLHGNEERRKISEKVFEWRGKLSTDPKKVHPDVSAKTMYNRCWDFSEELGLVLWEMGFSVDLAINKEGYPHTFLMIERGGYILIIDPTIAQVVEGHNNVFVGNSGQLHYLADTRSWWGYLPWFSPERKPIEQYFNWLKVK